MLVKDVMTMNAKFVAPNTSLEEIAKMMCNHDFGFIPIGEDDKLTGIITDRDIVIRALAKGLDMKKTQAGEILTEKVLYCFDDDTLEKAAKSMEKQQVSRLIVVNHNKRLVGIISLGDICRKTHNDALCGEVIDCIKEESRKAA